MTISVTRTVRPELVEGPFFPAAVETKKQGFDRLSPNGEGFAFMNENAR